MDPVTTTIVAALVSGAVAGVADVATAAVSDAYAALKRALLRRGDVEVAIEAVEEDPGAVEDRAALAAQIEATRPDDELQSLAQDLLDAIDGLRDDAAAQAVFDFDELRVARDLRLTDIEALGPVFRGGNVVVDGDFIAEGIRSGGVDRGK